MNTTTITVDRRIKKMLDTLKKHRRESYSEVLKRSLPAGHGPEFDSEALQETVEILSDPDIVASLAKSLEDLRKGRVHTFDEV